MQKENSIVTRNTTNTDFMKNATISDSTRDYLVAIGGFEDWSDRVYELVKRDFGSDAAEDFHRKIYPSYEELKKATYMAMNDKIEANLTNLFNHTAI